MLWGFIKNKMLEHPQKRICENEASLTYQEAVIYAENFARDLDKSYYVILCNSEMAAALALLSCFAAGVTAVPLSYRYGDQYVKNIFKTLKPSDVITDMGDELQIININHNDTALKDDPALIMFTSGTTGKPKGIMLSEGNLLLNLKDIKEYFKIDDKDKILIPRPLYHCAVLTGEFLISLICGLDIVFYSGGFDPGTILDLIEEQKITVMGGTPTLYYMLSKFLKNTSNLKKIVLSGEILNKNRALEIRKAFPDTQIYHVYGLTEASPRVAYLPPEYFDEFAEYVGIPLSSVLVRVVDDKGNKVPRGEDGELCVKGGSVMMGYFNQSGSPLSGSGWLHTGDIACIDKNDFIKIKCRKDDMIIRAGMNIYPQEIESVLKEHDSRIEEIVAYGMPDDVCGQRIGLKVKGTFEDKDEVINMCRKLLPAYEQPWKVELVDEIPRNGSGKIIRNNERSY